MGTVNKGSITPGAERGRAAWEPGPDGSTLRARRRPDRRQAGGTVWALKPGAPTRQEVANARQFEKPCTTPDATHARVRVVAWSALAGATLLLAGYAASAAGWTTRPADGPDGAAAHRLRGAVLGDPDGNAARQVRAYEKEGKTRRPGRLKKIARQPVAEWVNTENPARAHRGRVTKAAAAADRSALLVLYNVPHRDCGQYSEGGAHAADAYRGGWTASSRASASGRPR